MVTFERESTDYWVFLLIAAFREHKGSVTVSERIIGNGKLICVQSWHGNFIVSDVELLCCMYHVLELPFVWKNTSIQQPLSFKTFALRNFLKAPSLLWEENLVQLEVRVALRYCKRWIILNRRQNVPFQFGENPVYCLKTKFLRSSAKQKSNKDILVLQSLSRWNSTSRR